MFSVDFGIYHGPSLETQGWSVVRVGREDPTDRPWVSEDDPGLELTFNKNATDQEGRNAA